MTALLLSAALLASAAPGLDGHPIMAAMLNRTGDGLLAGPCEKALMPEWSVIASRESKEVKFAAKDMLDGSCRVSLLGVGEETFVRIDPEELDRELSDPAAGAVADVHTHPLENGAFFGAEAPYAGEIMFADESRIAERRLGRGWLERAQESVRADRAPGFNLSPPSIQDFLVASGAPDRVRSIVLTSGGSWTYSVQDPKLAREKLYDLVSYASIHEAASSGTPSARRERARSLWAGLLKDPAAAALIEAWAGPSLELRAPYSEEALRMLADGDGSAVRREFEAKLRSAEAFCGLLRTLGIEAAFTPFKP